MRTATTNPAGTTPMRPQRASWGAIFVGVVTALALMVLFTTIGLAIGASTIDPAGGASLGGLSIFSIIYLIVTQLIALFAGGYAAARLAGIPRMIASVLHGVAVWAVATLFLAVVAIQGGGALFSATANVLQTTARGAGSAVQAVIPNNMGFPDLSQLASQVSISDLPPELRETLRENDLTVQDLRTETQTAFRNVVSQQEQQRALNVVRGALTDAVMSPGDIGAEVNAAIDTLVEGENAVFSQEDRAEVLTALQTNLDISDSEAEQIAATIEQRFETAVEDLRATVQQLQDRAVQLAETATLALSRAALFLAVASVLSLIAAIGGAFVGKPANIMADRADDQRF